MRCTGPSCPAGGSRITRRGLQLFALAYNLANFLRQLALPRSKSRASGIPNLVAGKADQDWGQGDPLQVTIFFQLAEVQCRGTVSAILVWIARLRWRAPRGEVHRPGPGRLARAGRRELTLGGAIQVGSPKGRRALKGAVFIEHDSGSNQRRPRQIIGEHGRALSIFRQVHPARAPCSYASRNALCFRCRAKTSMNCGSLFAPQTAKV